MDIFVLKTNRIYHNTQAIGYSTENNTKQSFSLVSNSNIFCHIEYSTISRHIIVSIGSIKVKQHIERLAEWTLKCKSNINRMLFKIQIRLYP